MHIEMYAANVTQSRFLFPSMSLVKHRRTLISVPVTYRWCVQEFPLSMKRRTKEPASMWAIHKDAATRYFQMNVEAFRIRGILEEGGWRELHVLDGIFSLPIHTTEHITYVTFSQVGVPVHDYNQISGSGGSDLFNPPTCSVDGLSQKFSFLMPVVGDVRMWRIRIRFPFGRLRFFLLLWWHVSPLWRAEKHSGVVGDGRDRESWYKEKI